jgi:hypothetical protein
MKKVVLYGKSLVISTIGASLHDCRHLQVLVVDPALPDANQQLEALEPDAVIFSLGAAQPESLLSFLQLPDVLLIGVDPETQQALVWTARQSAAVAAMDLVSLILNGNNTD